MAQGKKYNDDIKERAFALLMCNNSVADVSKALNLPYSTIKTWKSKYLAKGAELAEKAKNGTADSADEGELDLAKLRQQEKDKLVRNAWRIIGKSQRLIERRIDKALNNPDNPDCEMGVRELSTVLGTLYDKQALACKDATEVVEGTVALTRFEDL